TRKLHNEMVNMAGRCAKSEISQVTTRASLRRSGRTNHPDLDHPALTVLGLGSVGLETVAPVAGDRPVVPPGHPQVRGAGPERLVQQLLRQSAAVVVGPTGVSPAV